MKWQIIVYQMPTRLLATGIEEQHPTTTNNNKNIKKRYRKQKANIKNIEKWENTETCKTILVELRRAPDTTQKHISSEKHCQHHLKSRMVYKVTVTRPHQFISPYWVSSLLINEKAIHTKAWKWSRWNGLWNRLQLTSYHLTAEYLNSVITYVDNHCSKWTMVSTYVSNKCAKKTVLPSHVTNESSNYTTLKNKAYLKNAYCRITQNSFMCQMNYLWHFLAN